MLRDRKASTSYIQRRLSIGYNRAASLIERMEKEGVVGQANHAGKREILVESTPPDAGGSNRGVILGRAAARPEDPERPPLLRRTSGPSGQARG